MTPRRLIVDVKELLKRPKRRDKAELAATVRQMAGRHSVLSVATETDGDDER